LLKSPLIISVALK